MVAFHSFALKTASFYERYPVSIMTWLQLLGGLFAVIKVLSMIFLFYHRNDFTKTLKAYDQGNDNGGGKMKAIENGC